MAHSAISGTVPLHSPATVSLRTRRRCDVSAPVRSRDGFRCIWWRRRAWQSCSWSSSWRFGAQTYRGVQDILRTVAYDETRFIREALSEKVATDPGAGGRPARAAGLQRPVGGRYTAAAARGTAVDPRSAEAHHVRGCQLRRLSKRRIHAVPAAAQRRAAHGVRSARQGRAAGAVGHPRPGRRACTACISSSMPTAGCWIRWPSRTTASIRGPGLGTRRWAMATPPS